MYWECRIVVVFLALLAGIAVIAQGTIKGYDLPVLPSAVQISASLGKLPELYRGIHSAALIGSIPKIFWVTMKDANLNDIAPHIRRVFDHHPSWKAIVADDSNADAFMRIVYANTSLLWAYDVINPSLGAAKADLWRYSVLYAAGGVYFDADSAFSLSLDKYITPEDKFILSSERNPMGECFAPPHPLSSTEELFNNKTILQWMIIAAPQHPFLVNTLTHSVEVIKMLYKKQPVLAKSAKEPFMAIICATGPVLYANAIRQVVQKYKAEGRVKELGYRYAGYDFEEIGGKYKAAGFQWNSRPGYYQNQMNKMGVPLLKSYES